MRALAKLEQVLPSRLRRRVNALETYTVPVPLEAAGPTVDVEVLTALAGACRDQQRLRFDYRDHGGSASPAPSSHTGWCAGAAAGTWWPGTWNARTGAPSASTASAPRPDRPPLRAPRAARQATSPPTSRGASRPPDGATAPR